MKLKHSKKGLGIDDAVAAIVVIGVMGIIVFFVFYLFQHAEENKRNLQLQMEKDTIDGNRLLIEYITSIDSNGKSRADSISQLIEKKEFNTIKTDMTSYFQPKLSHLTGWKILILDSEGNIQSSLDGGDYSHSAQSYRVSSIFLPLPSQDYAILQLYYGRGYQTREFPVR